jgi:hypothetical protein
MPLYPPRPSPRPKPGPPSGRKPARPVKGQTARIRWGWLEWFIVSQTALPALVFVPGVSVSPTVRNVTRIAAYVMALLAWVMVARRGRVSVGVTTFPARPWLLCVIGWLTLSIGHPGIYSLGAAVAQVVLYLAVLSPAFWAGQALESPRQINRVMALLFLCSALSAVVGIGQVYYPERFNPPYIPAMHGIFQGEDLMYEGAGGRKIMRPCGLTDTPGAAASAGAVTALIGLCWALRPIAGWKRAASVVLAISGVAVIYFTQVRTNMVMLVMCVITLMSILLYHGHARSAFALASGGVAALIGALLWVGRTVGSQASDRFGTLVSADPGNLFYRARGGYVLEAFQRIIWEYPLGYGLGWWGMTNMLFADPARISPVWVEVMIPGWIFDGGAPLLILYAGALVVAVADSFRIAVTSRDRDISFWGAVIVAYNLSIVANCFSYVTFLSSLGPPFWLFSAMLHAADAQARASATNQAPARPQPRPRPRPWPWSAGAAAQ